MAGLPSSYIYFIRNGRLVLLPHSENIESEIPEKYAQVYNKKTGSISNNNIDIKVFIISKDGNKIKHLIHGNMGIIQEYLERI